MKKTRKSTRGFKSIVGKKILGIDAQTINNVDIVFTDGTRFSINTDGGSVLGIGIVQCQKYKKDGTLIEF